MGQNFRPCGLLQAHWGRLWPGIIPGLRLLANTSHCLGTPSLSFPYPLYFSIHIPFWGEILHYFCFVLGCLLSLSLLTRGNKRNKQKQGISCLAATDTGLPALQRSRHLRPWMGESAAALSQPRDPRGSQPVRQSALMGGIHQSWYEHLKMNQK